MLLPIPSFNSERLYEILWHHSHAGDKHFLTYDILRLKIMLGLADKDGKAEKYKSWRDFKYVLDRAREDFKEYTNLRFNYQGIRNGRSYKQIRFVLTLNQPAALPELRNVSSPADPKKEFAVRQLAKDLGDSGYLQDPYEAIEAYGLEDVRDTLRLARDAERKAAASSKPIYNLGGLVTHMLKSGVARRRRTAQAQDPGPRPPSTTDIRRVAETLVTAFSNNRAEHARALWNRLGREEQEAVIDIMRVELDSTTLRIIDKANWQGASFESIRNAFLFQSQREEFPKEACDIANFVKHEGLLEEFSEEDRKKIVKGANDLL